MSRLLTIAAAQMGPVQLDDSRDDVVERLVGMLQEDDERQPFDFDRCRVPEAYARITAQRGAIRPEESR